MDSRFVEGTYGLLIRRNAWLPREGPQRWASSVIVHRVAPDLVERFLELERGITEAAKAFPGYQATDVYPPADSRQAEWVVVIHFDGPENLQRWLGSPVRAEWVEKLRKEMGDFRSEDVAGRFRRLVCRAWSMGRKVRCPRRGKSPWRCYSSSIRPSWC